MDLISIIIPVYKVEPYLEQCIESVVNQTYQNLEILLVDDGSPDRCPEMCDAWAKKDPRIRFVHKQNGGLSDARNVGMAAATGKYIAFVDSDDIVEPEYIAYLHRTLQETGADLVECSYDRFSGQPERGASAEMTTAQPIIQTPEEALIKWSSRSNRCMNCVVWDKLYRREMIADERFAVGYYAQDALFSCRIFGKCRTIAYIENDLYHWRNTPGSATHQFPKQRVHVMEMYDLSLRYLERNYPRAAKDCKIFMCSHCTSFFNELLNEGAKGSADEIAKAKRTMRSIRREDRFTREEWARCSLRDKMRIVCSSPALVGVYARLRPTLAVLLHWEE